MIPLHKKIGELTWGDLLTGLNERYGYLDMNIVPAVSSNHATNDFMNTDECALLTGYKPAYIRQMVFKRTIPFHKNPRLKPVRFKRSEILAWMATKKFTPINERAEDYITDNPSLKNKKNQ